jgi:hypothetical protein
MNILINNGVRWQENSSFGNFGLRVGSWGLQMCCFVRWGFFVFARGEKKQNKFPSNLHCPVKKLNPFYFQFITIVSVCSSVFTLVANVSPSKNLRFLLFQYIFTLLN